SRWGAILEQLGELLYQRARPALTVLTATGDREFDGSPSAAERRRLIVGWRTWYGPAYVEPVGRVWLLAWPGAAAPTGDGAVGRMIREQLLKALQQDHDATFEVWTNELPSDLQAELDDLAASTGRLTYAQVSDGRNFETWDIRRPPERSGKL